MESKNKQKQGKRHKRYLKRIVQNTKMEMVKTPEVVGKAWHHWSADSELLRKLNKLLAMYFYKKKSILDLSKDEEWHWSKCEELRPVIKEIRETFIPFFHSFFDKGTQVPVLRLPFSSTAISSVAATDYTTVLSLSASLFLNFSSLAVVFDEYRVIRGEVHYRSNRSYFDPSGSIKGQSVAIIDYDDVAALTTFDGALSYDTHQQFPACSYDESAYPVAWPVLLEPMPDQDWITTATTNSVFAAWKPFIGTTYSGGVTLGSLAVVTGWMDVQFRGMF